MNTPTSVVDAQLQHLLEVVEQDRKNRCREIIEAAQDQARHVVRQARRNARTRIHEDFSELREQIRQRIASAEAQQQTRMRMLRQQADQDFLAAAWKPLQQALQRHWLETEHRKQWVMRLVEKAAATLIDPHWLIEHPPDWPAHECNTLKEKLSRDFECFPSFEPHPRITAGLRICAAGACVDGSIEGLLQRRTYIEALLLAEIRKQHGALTEQQA